MSLRHLDLTDFRLFEHAEVEPDAEGTTVLTGPNGTGKTTVLEAVAYLGTQRSFRGAPKEVLLRTGSDRAICGLSWSRTAAASWSKPRSPPSAGRGCR